MTAILETVSATSCMSNSIANSATNRLKDAFSQALLLPPDMDYDSLAYASTPGWDSVAHMALIAGIEAAFDIMLSTDDVIGMSSFQIAKETVARHGVTFE
jgi:acyl carrier protein